MQPKVRLLYDEKIIVLIIAALLAILFALAGCSKDEETETERTERLLQSTWKLDKLTVDDLDQTSLYSNLQLTVDAGTYSTQQGGVVWPATGTWSLIDATTIRRDNDLVITIKSISETNLALSFIWKSNTYGQGRTTSIAGNHTFEFSRK